MHESFILIKSLKELRTFFERPLLSHNLFLTDTTTRKNIAYSKPVTTFSPAMTCGAQMG